MMTFDDLWFALLLFFFSSRRRHTRLQGDWSSDVCSSDLLVLNADEEGEQVAALRGHDGVGDRLLLRVQVLRPALPLAHRRSEERRVGKECRSRWSPYH